MATPKANLDLEMICDHFPDAVDVQKTSGKKHIEYTYNRTGPMRTTKTELHLKELEPETGIYAAMSPITHRVYVYVDLQEHC